MKSTNLTFLLLVVIASATIFSMDPPVNSEMKKNPEWNALALRVLTGDMSVRNFLSTVKRSQKKIQNNFDFASLLPEVQLQIISIITNGQNAETIDEAARAVSDLARVNKKFNVYINNPQVCNGIINSFAQKFGIDPFVVMKKLQIKAAKQAELFQLCTLEVDMNQQELVNELQLLHKQGTDFDFLYSIADYPRNVLPRNVSADYPGDCTPLMLLCSHLCTAKNSHIFMPILEFFLSKNVRVNVNKANNAGTTALMLLCQNSSPHREQEVVFLSRLLQSPDIAIENQDKKGNTALIYCARANVFMGVAKRLLEKGACLNRSNNNGETALIFLQRKAQETSVLEPYLEQILEIDHNNQSSCPMQ